MNPTSPVCRECGKEPAMLRGDGRVVNGRCNACMGRLLRAGKSRILNSAVRIRFLEEPDLLEQLRRLARSEYRTLEAQILYTLRKGLEEDSTE